MKKYFLIASVSLLGFYSCQDSADAEADADDADSTIVDADSLAIDKVDTVLSNETISFFNQSGFSDFAKSKAPEFDWSKFRMTDSWQEDSLLVTNFSPAKGYYEAYKKLLRYSPDSTKFIDLDSYNIAIEKDGKGGWKGHESGPDTEIAMVDTKTRKKTRLLFTGPGSSVEDGSWIDSENIVLMGFQDSHDKGKLPVIWRYNVPASTYYIYEMPDPKVATKLLGQWKKERLKGVRLQ